MRMYMITLVGLLLLIAIPDTFFYLKHKRRDSNTFYIIVHLIPALIFTSLFLYIKFELENLHNFRIVVAIMWLFFFFLLIYISKLIHAVFFALEYFYKKISGKSSIYFFIARIGFTVYFVAIMLISAYITPRNFDVTQIQIPISNLPISFDGFKIVQISDLHLGSWNRKFSKLYPVIKLVNEQHADIIVLTGDLVNNFAEETIGWRPYFSKLKAKSGKFAILGNHDYGDYTNWSIDSLRTNNRKHIQNSFRNFGFKLLKNESVYIKHNSDSILLIGIENWNKDKKSNYSNLNLSLRNTKKNCTKILLSHDPSIWDSLLIGHSDIDLTLSGHTHAGQLGIRIGKQLFSPAAFVFKYWSGLYTVKNQFLYVNRGIGYIGLPMYIGVRPEITVIELKRKQN